MNGIIDVGGGLRGIYSAGIYDYLLDHGVQFDYCLGVSAGSANLITYLAGQKGRCREHSETETFHGWGGFKGDWLMGRRVGL